MNEFSVQSVAERELSLTHAILLYTEQGRHNSANASFITVHDIKDTGTKARPNVQIMPGHPITKEALLSMVQALANKASINTEFLPENVLSISASHVVWWVPSKDRAIFFDNPELGKRSAIVPNPPLVFSVMKNRWNVFALKENVRPTPDTPIFHAPYFNINEAGFICAGSTRTPKSYSTKTLGDWEKAFFESAFTHTNGAKKLVDHPRGEYAFWKEMLDGDYKEFPLEMLVPRNLALSSVMGDIHDLLGEA